MFIYSKRYVIYLNRRALYDKRISQEVSGEDLGDEFAGYVRFYIIVRSSY